jgi:hypothetical protein
MSNLHLYSFTMATPSTCTCVFTVNDVFDITKRREKGAQIPGDQFCAVAPIIFGPITAFLSDIKMCTSSRQSNKQRQTTVTFIRHSSIVGRQCGTCCVTLLAPKIWRWLLDF